MEASDQRRGVHSFDQLPEMGGDLLLAIRIDGFGVVGPQTYDDHVATPLPEIAVGFIEILLKCVERIEA